MSRLGNLQGRLQDSGHEPVWRLGNLLSDLRFWTWRIFTAEGRAHR